MTGELVLLAGITEIMRYVKALKKDQKLISIYFISKWHFEYKIMKLPAIIDILEARKATFMFWSSNIELFHFLISISVNFLYPHQVEEELLAVEEVPEE